MPPEVRTPGSDAATNGDVAAPRGKKRTIVDDDDDDDEVLPEASEDE